MKNNVLPFVLSASIGLILGALGYCCLVFFSCFMDTSPQKHPVAFLLSILVGFGCAVMLVVLGWGYIKLRKKYPSILMTVVDILLALALVLPSLLAWSNLANLIFA